LGEALDARCELTLWSNDAYLDDLRAAARRREMRARVHAKIDTGVTRLGMPAERAPQRIAEYLEDDALEVVGVFSHLAAAEELVSSYTEEQVRRFRAATAAVPARIERHLAASAAAMLYPETRFDVIRPGIATYGIWPSEGTRAILEIDGVTLVPALSWRSEIVLVHDVPAGTSVGYGCTFSTSQPSRIGVLPIGYAEGIPRAAGNRGEMLAAGRRVPIVGRVCMNMTFLDLTDAPGAVAGSTVTLIGSDGAQAIEAAQWGEWCETIGYEIVARLPREVPRNTNVPVPPAVSHLR
jgi:alanine racemase